MDLNSRELALLLWTGIALLALLLSANLRPALIAVARAMLHPKIASVVGFAAFYSIGCVWLLARAGLWRWDNLKTTIVWFAATAVVAIASTKQLERGASALWALVRDAISITAIVLFVGSINTLPFLVEFLLVPILTAVAVMVAVAERQPENRIVIAPLNSLRIIVGLLIIGYSVYRLIADWQKFDAELQIREFFIPIALTLMFLPYLYGLILFMGFENATIRLKFKIKDQSLRRYVWWRGIVAFGASSTNFMRFVHAIQMSEVTDRTGVKSVLATLRRSMQREKSPPPVDWEDGWSPYAAIDFLADHDLRARYYRPSIVEWSADSPYRKLSEDVLPDHLVYYISGTETAATEIRLELDAQISSHVDFAESAFWAAALALVQKALGDGSAESLSRVIPTDKHVSLDSGGALILLERDAWQRPNYHGYRRKLTIRHRAHNDPFAKFV